MSSVCKPVLSSDNKFPLWSYLALFCHASSSYFENRHSLWPFCIEWNFAQSAPICFPLLHLSCFLKILLVSDYSTLGRARTQLFVSGPNVLISFCCSDIARWLSVIDAVTQHFCEMRTSIWQNLIALWCKQGWRTTASAYSFSRITFFTTTWTRWLMILQANRLFWSVQLWSVPVGMGACSSGTAVQLEPCFWSSLGCLYLILTIECLCYAYIKVHMKPTCLSSILINSRSLITNISMKSSRNCCERRYKLSKVRFWLQKVVQRYGPSVALSFVFLIGSTS